MSADAPLVVDLRTPRGAARAHIHGVAGPRALMVLGHGAGGGVAAPDLVAVTGEATARGVAVALVEQPYRVAGRRAPDRAPALDAAWGAVLEALRARPKLAGLPVICGGRSSGARVACRTAADVGAAAVLALAFPVTPAPRRDGTRGPHRLPELDAVAVPVLVVQGTRDRFGMPPPGPTREIVAVAADHSLKGDIPAVRAAAGTWLDRILTGT